MALGCAEYPVIEKHYRRRPTLPANYLDLSHAQQQEANRIYDLKYQWWVVWFEYLLALGGRPTRRCWRDAVQQEEQGR
jgi:hypothetical protein